MAGSTSRQRTPPETPFAERVQRALQYARLSHTEVASMLSNRLNRTIKPQVIQYLSVKARRSALSTDLAAVCNVDAEWLASANGLEPGTGTQAYQVRAEPRHLKAPAVTTEEKLRELIDTKVIGKKDLELLLQIAERMAKQSAVRG